MPRASSSRRQRAPSAFAVAGFEPDAVYEDCVRLLRVANICAQLPFEAEQRRDVSAVEQAVRDRSRAFTLPFHDGDKLAFARSAMRMQHPAQADPDDLPRDLCAAVAFTVARGSGIIQFRRDRMRLLRDVARRLAPHTTCMRRTLTAPVLHVAGEYHFAFIACLIDATREPDVFFVRRLMRGFPGYGDLVPSGVYRSGGEGPSLPVSSVFQAGHQAWNDYLAASISCRGRAANADDQSESFKSAKAAFDATIAECEGGWCLGVWDHATGSYRGFTPREVGEHPWVGGPDKWRGVRRFAVFQKNKWRPIDDATESGMNLVTGASDRLSLITADAAARIAREYYTQHRLRGLPYPEFQYGTDDVKKAFRRLPNAAFQCYVLMLWDYVRCVVAYFILPSFIFGCYSAVHAWNRVPALYCHIFRRLLAVAIVMYFDDAGIGQASYEEGSGQDSINELALLIGLDFDPSKHEEPSATPTALGVVSDFSLSRLSLTTTISVSQSRRESISEWCDSLLAKGYVTTSDASSLVGKSRYVLCPVFGRVGLACLQPLYQMSHPTTLDRDSELLRCVLFVREAVLRVRPAVFPLCPSPSQLVFLIWTDASGAARGDHRWWLSEEGATPPRLGVVVYDPRQRRWHFALCDVPAWMRALFWRMSRKQTYICQWEVLACLCAYLTFPDLLAGELAHHFIDNMPALNGCIKGSSSRPESARLIDEYSLAVLSLSCRPWLSFVYSRTTCQTGRPGVTSACCFVWGRRRGP